MINMQFICSQKDCTIPHTDCLLGNDSPTKCKYAKKTGGNNLGQKQSSNTISNLEGQGFPWTGISLGEKDLAFLSASRSLHLVGLVGVDNSGKPTLLTILYCLLRQGYCIGDYFLAGSYTLAGWETLAYYMTWKAGNEISFPPHTSGTMGRVPGLLHLALQKESGERKDLVLTDAKGEWFSDWAINAGLNTAATPEWIQSHSQSFILIADSEALAGPQRGATRDQIKNLFNRLKNTLGNRPLALAWTKSDSVVREGISESIEQHVKKDAPISNVFKVSAFKGSGETEATDGQIQVLKMLDWLISSEGNLMNEIAALSRASGEDFFLSYRQ